MIPRMSDEKKTVQKLYGILKILWILAVIVFVILYLGKHGSRIGSVFSEMPFAYLAASFILLAAGKMFLVINMRLSLRYVDVSYSFSKCYGVYNTTQLAKYIPGSIWQFVGKAGIYKQDGMDTRAIGNALVLEVAWVLGSAFVIGLGIVWIARSALIQKVGIQYGGYFLIPTAATLVIVLAAMFRFKASLAFLLDTLKRVELNLKAALVQLFIWAFLGSSFAAVAAPYLDGADLSFYAVGLFALAYIIGFSIPFAPAGLGIREGILVLGLIEYLPEETAVFVAGASRVVYILVEIFLVLLLPAFRDRAGSPPAD